MQPNYKDMNASLRLCPGGILYYGRHESGEQGSVLEVTDEMYRFLMYTCELDENFTLKDLFILIDKHLDILEPVVGNWIRELSQEIAKPAECLPGEIDFLNLYWDIQTDDAFGTNGFEYPSFDGVSLDGQTYALDFANLDSLSHLPIRLQPDANVRGNDTVLVLKKVPFTLMDIIYGVVWELSFYGSPVQRGEKLEKLQQAADEFREHFPQSE